ncbi:hypothetical protein [Ostreiculturibacter nitratireducens]
MSATVKYHRFGTTAPEVVGPYCEWPRRTKRRTKPAVATATFAQ